jgi:hypothetical protein
VHATGEVIVESHGPEGTRLRARIPKESVARFASYRVE